MTDGTDESDGITTNTNRNTSAFFHGINVRSRCIFLPPSRISLGEVPRFVLVVYPPRQAEVAKLQVAVLRICGERKHGGAGGASHTCVSRKAMRRPQPIRQTTRRGTVQSVGQPGGRVYPTRSGERCAAPRGTRHVHGHASNAAQQRGPLTPTYAQPR